MYFGIQPQGGLYCIGGFLHWCDLQGGTKATVAKQAELLLLHNKNWSLRFFCILQKHGLLVDASSLASPPPPPLTHMHSSSLPTPPLFRLWVWVRGCAKCRRAGQALF